MELAGEENRTVMLESGKLNECDLFSLVDHLLLKHRLLGLFVYCITASSSRPNRPLSQWNTVHILLLFQGSISISFIIIFQCHLYKIEEGRSLAEKGKYIYINGGSSFSSDSWIRPLFFSASHLYLSR